MGVGIGIPGGSRAAAAAWSPADLPNLEVWLKADAGVQTDVDGVYQWDDQSGNENHAIQTTGSIKPALNSADQNGLDAIQGDGIDDELTFTCASLAGGYTFYVAGEHLQNGNGKISIQDGVAIRFVETGASLLGLWHSNYSHTTTVGWGVKTTAGLSNTNGAQRSSIFGAGLTREDKTGTGGAPPAASNFTLFSTSGSLTKLYEVLIYLTAHDEATMEQAYTYLNDKWGHIS